MYAEQNIKSMMEIISKMEQQLPEKQKQLQDMENRLDEVRLLYGIPCKHTLLCRRVVMPAMSG